MRTIQKSHPISDTREDYVRAIYVLSELDGSVGVTKIADKLGLSKSTVSERLNGLVKDGLVVAEPYADVKLTKSGLDLGRKLTYKHRVIEVFLNRILKIPKHKVHAEAHLLEHAFSDDAIQRLARFLDNPKSDPHGSAIPKIKNWN